MPLHKIVDGKKVDLSPEEERAFIKEWAENEIRHKQEEALMTQKKILRQQAKQKLYSKAGLTAEEISALEDNLTGV